MDKKKKNSNNFDRFSSDDASNVSIPARNKKLANKINSTSKKKK